MTVGILDVVNGVDIEGVGSMDSAGFPLGALVGEGAVRSRGRLAGHPPAPLPRE